MKTYLVTNMPAVYRIDFYNELQKRYGSEAKICFIREPAIDYKKSVGVFEGEPFLQISHFFYNDLAIVRSFRFVICLLLDRPKVIVNSGMSLRCLLLSAYCKIFGCKLIIWWAGTEISEAKVSFLKSTYRKIIFRLSNGLIYYSEYAFEYFNNRLAIDKAHVILGNNTRDALAYTAQVQAQDVRKNGREVIFITVGFQTKRKNTITLLEVFREPECLAANAELHVVGDGPELEILRSYAKANNMNNVQFIGDVDPENLTKFYASADVFIHPSLLDQWPQTYNEACAAGLPVLISDHSGVCDGYTRTYKDIATFHPLDKGNILSSILRLAKSKKLREEMGAKARDISHQTDVRKAVDLFVGFVSQYF